MYRGEARSAGEDLSKPESVGVHWTTHRGYVRMPVTDDAPTSVVWHADVGPEHISPATEDIYGEAQVVLRPGSHVKLLGRQVSENRRAMDEDAPVIPMGHTTVAKGKHIKGESHKDARNRQQGRVCAHDMCKDADGKRTRCRVQEMAGQ